MTSTVATHISTRHLKTVPDTSSTSTVTTFTTTTHLKTVRDTSSTSTVTTSTTPAISTARTSTIPVTSARTSTLPVTPVCVDAPLCYDPHTKSSACNDNYIAAKYCPKMCGVCGKIYALVICNHCSAQASGKSGDFDFLPAVPCY